MSFASSSTSADSPSVSSTPSQPEAPTRSQSVSSTHSRSASSSTLSRSSTSSSLRSTSFSQISSAQSGPFENISALDSASSSILSFYFDPDPSEVRKHPGPLVELIRTSGHTGQVLERLLGMVSMIVHIGTELFPHSHIICEDVIKEVQFLAETIIEYLEAVKAYISMRTENTRAAFFRLPSRAITDAETLALSISQWTKILEGLHVPNGVDARIFRKLLSLFDSHIYLPFLQLHRIEPDHHMYEALDDHLTPISILLKDIYRGAKYADQLVLDIEQEFELTMSAEPSPSLSSKTSRTSTPELTSPSGTPPSGTPPSIAPKAAVLNSGGEMKAQHTPSKSAPTFLAIRPMIRPRAGTVQ